MTHDRVKEKEIISFKFFCISVRCMGTGFMNIVVLERSVEVAFLSSYAPLEGRVFYNGLM